MRVGVDAERVLVGRGEHVALLADDRADDDLAGVHQAASLLARVGCSPLARAVSASSASWRRARRAAPTRSATPTSVGGQHRRRASRLRKDSADALLRRRRGRRAPSRLRPSRRAARRPAWSTARRTPAASKTAIEPRSACTRQRAAQRGAALLAVDLEGVVARLRAEDGAAAGPDRRARRAGAGAAGALLAPRLGAAAADLAARLGRRACPGGARRAPRGPTRGRAGR